MQHCWRTRHPVGIFVIITATFYHNETIYHCTFHYSHSSYKTYTNETISNLCCLYLQFFSGFLSHIKRNWLWLVNPVKMETAQQIYRQNIFFKPVNANTNERVVFLETQCIYILLKHSVLYLTDPLFHSQAIHLGSSKPKRFMSVGADFYRSQTYYCPTNSTKGKIMLIIIIFIIIITFITNWQVSMVIADTWSVGPLLGFSALPNVCSAVTSALQSAERSRPRSYCLLTAENQLVRCDQSGSVPLSDEPWIPDITSHIQSNSQQFVEMLLKQQKKHTLGLLLLLRAFI